MKVLLSFLAALGKKKGSWCLDKPENGSRNSVCHRNILKTINVGSGICCHTKNHEFQLWFLPWSKRAKHCECIAWHESHCWHRLSCHLDFTNAPVSCCLESHAISAGTCRGCVNNTKLDFFCTSLRDWKVQNRWCCLDGCRYGAPLKRWLCIPGMKWNKLTSFEPRFTSGLFH